MKKFLNSTETGYGRRIRIAITQCGLKLPLFGRKYKIALSHLYALEKEERPLSQSIVERIASGVRQEGYFCTAEWIITGEGLAPCKESELKKTILGSIKDLTYVTSLLPSELESFISPELKILQEQALFHELHTNSVVVGIFDDAMEPFYCSGDYVGGIMREELSLALNKDCIIQLVNGDQLIRRLTNGSISGCYNLSATNPFTKISNPVIFDQQVENAAPIIWHRRKDYSE